MCSPITNLYPTLYALASIATRLDKLVGLIISLNSPPAFVTSTDTTMLLLTHFPASNLIPCSQVNRQSWTLLLWLKHNLRIPRYEHSSRPRLLHWSLKRSPCLSLCAHSTATRLPHFSALWCPGNGDALCFIICTDFLILASEQLRSLLHLSLYGLASKLMFANEPALVSSVNMPRFSATSALHILPFPSLTLVLTSCTSTWSDHFRHHEDSRIFSLVLIALPDGQKLFPLPPRRLTSLLALSSVDGYLALVSRPLLLQTVVGNLNHTCGAT